MMDVEQFIKRLEAQNKLPDTTEAQREANAYRIKCIKLINRPKTPEEPYVRLDPVSERLKDPNFTCTLSSLLQR
ncbi:hypothetical protein [Peribacillus frigoritolerans]|uniref:hypothetical protein n=1 Tax=Peribacillus frigoritolerans TaxID=450367 RepID=UPI003F81D15B